MTSAAKLPLGHWHRCYGGKFTAGVVDISDKFEACATTSVLCFVSSWLDPDLGGPKLPTKVTKIQVLKC
jgi:hypothetical protein